MSVRVDSLHWVRPTAVILGTTVVDPQAGQQEDERAPHLVLQWAGELPGAEFTLNDFEVFPMMEVRLPAICAHAACCGGGAGSSMHRPAHACTASPSANGTDQQVDILYQSRSGSCSVVFADVLGAA